MAVETRSCQNCKQDFKIAPEDFNFYEKVEVPPPTFCSKCRLQRRLGWFNFTHLYKRKCRLCGEEKISMYHPDADVNVYCPRCWWSDDWDPLEYGHDYDFNKPFFQQWQDLFREAPVLGLSIGMEAIDTSPYCNHAGEIKNCYLLFEAGSCEDCSTGFYQMHNKMLFDCSLIYRSEHCYDLRNGYRNNRVVGSENTVESINSYFLRNCRNCSDCFGSANLRSKKYVFFNEQLTKEEYEKRVGEIDLGSHKVYMETKDMARKHWQKFPPQPRVEDRSVDVSGNYVFDSKNCHDCFEVNNAKDCKHLMLMMDGPVTDCYDLSSWGENMDKCYECCVVGKDVANTKFCQEAGLDLKDVEYCKLSVGASDQFGCVSVRKKKYCILNKQYSKGEYEKLLPKIKKHMDEMPYTDKKGRVYKYGEFFPLEMSPFLYKDSVAQLLFPLDERQIRGEGWFRADDVKKRYPTAVDGKDLPDHIRDAPDEIAKESIKCISCTGAYKILSMELDFLKKMKLPLPRECNFCRLDRVLNEWVKQLDMKERICDKCSKEFQTPYGKDVASEIWCKECYFKETV